MREAPDWPQPVSDFFEDAGVECCPHCNKPYAPRSGGGGGLQQHEPNCPDKPGNAEPPSNFVEADAPEPAVDFADLAAREHLRAFVASVPETDMDVCQVRTLPRLHRKSAESVARVVDLVLTHWANTKDVFALTVFRMLPRMILRGKSGKGTTRLVRERCDAFLRGSWAHLWSATEQELFNPAPTSETGLTRRAVNQAVRLIQQGELSRAVNRALSPGLFELSSETAHILESKFPSQDEPTFPATDAHVDVDTYRLGLCVSGLGRSLAADHDGWRHEHFQAIWDMDGIENLLTAVVEDLLNNELPLQAMRQLAPTKGAAFKKPGRDNDLRPLGMGSKLRVIATAYSNSLHTEKLKGPHGTPISGTLRTFDEFFLQHGQYGTGVKGGLEAMTHYLRLLCELHPDKVLIKLDILNAFNSFLRQKGIEVLADEFPDVVTLLKNFYSHHSPSHFSTAEQELLTVMLEAGSSQGDVYGGLLFCAAYSHVLISARNRFASEGVDIVAYHDDTYIHCYPRQVNAVLAYLSSKASEICLEFRLDKSAMYRPNGHIPRTCASAISKRDEGGLIVCGTPVGTDSYITEQLQEILERYVGLHELIRALPDAQCQYLLLRFCCCQNLNHWMRTCPPRLVEPYCEQFDDEVKISIEIMLKMYGSGQAPEEHVRLSDLHYEQCTQHVKLGGLGLSRTELVLPAAWIGSWALTKNLIKARLYQTPHHDILDTISGNPHGLPTLTEVARVHEVLAVAFADNGSVIEELDKLERAPDKAQRHFTHPLLQNLDRHLSSEFSSDLRNKARFKSCRGKKAGAWLNAIPTTPAFTIKAPEFRICLRLRLGLVQPCIFTSCRCKCGAAVDPYGDHYLTCKAGGHLITRHDNVVTACAQTARTAQHITRITGLSDFFETRTSTGKRLVPDLVVSNWADDGGDVAGDVSICHPCADSYIKEAASCSLGAALARERRKNGKYQAAATQQGVGFIPLVAETFGAWSFQLVDFMRDARRMMADKLPEDTATSWTAASFSGHFSQRISVAIAKGNARAIRLRATRDFALSGYQPPMVDPPVYEQDD
jgi:hypothetical protein